MLNYQLFCNHTGEIDEMCVTWLTTKTVQPASAKFGLDNSTLSLSVNATQTEFVDGGIEKLVRFIHSATLGPLKSGHVYCK